MEGGILKEAKNEVIKLGGGKILTAAENDVDKIGGEVENDANKLVSGKLDLKTLGGEIKNDAKSIGASILNDADVDPKSDVTKIASGKSGPGVNPKNNFMKVDRKK